MEETRNYGIFTLKVSGKIPQNPPKSPRLGLGMEKLDRQRFNPEKVYDWVDKSGVKWVRIQSGWAITEASPGVYDFGWLDAIVDRLNSMGCIPWMCLCYGNELYDPGADNKTGAFGRPPRTPEQMAAWGDYVRAVTAHYKGRIQYYEIWNEPDGPWCWVPSVNAAEYGEFASFTGRVIKESDDDALVIAGSFCMGHTLWLERAFRAGMGDYADYLTYHNYRFEPEEGFENLISNIRCVIDKFNPKIKLIQGEVGSPSRGGGLGALSAGQWTESAQAKMLLRRLVLDLASEVEFTSWFSAVDMIENVIRFDPKCPEKSYGFFGVLRENLVDGFPTSEYNPKPSYFALRNLCALFKPDVKPTVLAIQYEADRRVDLQEKVKSPFGQVYSYGFSRDNGSRAFVYWMASDLRRVDYHGDITLNISGIPGEIRLIDTLTGEILEIPEVCTESGIPLWDGSTLIAVTPEDTAEFGDRVLRLPMRDYPLMLTFGDYLDN